MTMRNAVSVIALLIASAFDGTAASGDEKVKPGRRFIAIDLQSYANKKLDTDFHTYPGNNLKTLPRGPQKLADVEFVIGEKFLQLAGKRAPDNPERVEAIRVDRKVTKLHFLHGTGWGSPGVSDGTPIGEYIIHFDDQSSETVPVEYGRDVRDWWMLGDSDNATRAVIAWTGMNQASQDFRGIQVKIRLFRRTWENPHPDKKIVGFDYISRNDTICSPFLIAVAAEASIDEAAIIDKLKDAGALLEFDDANRLTKVFLAGPGGRRIILRGSNEIVMLLADLVSIESIDLNSSSVTDNGLIALKDLPNLRALSLNLTQITDGGLSHLKTIKSLERLRLHQTSVTDEGLRELSLLSHLKVLDLSKTGVTDAGLPNLESLKSLEELDLRNTRCTEAGVATLKSSLKNTRIAR